MQGSYALIGPRRHFAFWTPHAPVGQLFAALVQARVAVRAKSKAEDGRACACSPHVKPGAERLLANPETGDMLVNGISNTPTDKAASVNLRRHFRPDRCPVRRPAG